MAERLESFSYWSDKLGFVSRFGLAKGYKNWYSLFPAWLSSLKLDSVKSLHFVIDRWPLDSNTESFFRYFLLAKTSLWIKTWLFLSRWLFLRTFLSNTDKQWRNHEAKEVLVPPPHPSHLENYSRKYKHFNVFWTSSVSNGVWRSWTI